MGAGRITRLQSLPLFVLLTSGSTADSHTHTMNMYIISGCSSAAIVQPPPGANPKEGQRKVGEMKEERKRGKKIKQPKPNKTQTSVAKTLFSVLDSPEPAWAFVLHGGMAPFKDAALINIALNNQIISDRRKVPANGA